MESKLELLFNVEHNKNKLKVLSWQEQQQERWNKDLKTELESIGYNLNII